jgi:hypothetical protein
MSTNRIHDCPTCTCGESETELARLRRICAENSYYVTPDGCVFDDVAAKLLDRRFKTLGNWRRGGTGPKFVRYNKSSRIRYRLEDLAAYIESCRNG